MQRPSWNKARNITLFLLTLSIALTIIFNNISRSHAILLAFAFVDAFIFFLCLILLQITWNFGDAKHARRQVQQTSSSPQSLFPMTMNSLLRLSPTEFEEFVGIVIEAMGMEYTEVQQIGGSGDRGADLLARNTFNLRIIVQCKLYTPGNQVGSPDLQRFLGSITHYKAVYGWFITTSTFTKPALDFAAVNREIRLLDGEQLIALITQRQREMHLIWQLRQGGGQSAR